MAQPVKKQPALADFDNIQLAMPDIHSVPRGKVVSGKFKDIMVNEGFDMFRGSTMLSPKSEVATSVPSFSSSNRSHNVYPCLETLTPWPWVSTEKHSVGSIICDMYSLDGSLDHKCPRQQLAKQLYNLRMDHDLIIKTAFEYEFFVFKENTLEPLGRDHCQKYDLRVWGENQELFSQLRETIQSMGIDVRAIEAEVLPGQWELTTDPYPGVTAGDVGFNVKNAVKGFLKTQGYDATFMTRPKLSSGGSALHLNHSLWKLTDGQEENVFFRKKGGLSSTAEHWMAGLLYHAKALSALLCPSLNCYRHLHSPFTPSFSTWGLDDREALIRARVLGNNVFLENRLVSSAASPYLAIAATVAAGLDGLERRLECPPANDVTSAQELPRSLAQALAALENDHQLKARLGEEFVYCFVNSKRELEISALEKADLRSEEEQIAFERDMYFKAY